MKRYLLAAVLIFSVRTTLFSQAVLEANGPGETYELINSIFAPGHNVIEAPDCNHSDFGRHIDEVFDSDLNSNIFRFYLHKTPDSDRCINFDRQRNEIKTYDKSPDSLVAVKGETVMYTWKFKLDANFQPSSSFTHIHQIKSVGGSFSSIPMITLTLRKANPNKLELRYTPTNDQNTIAQENLSLFVGQWLEVTELITFGEEGSYSIEIKRISDNQTIMSYANADIDTWQDGAEFARPKWGIYRSLNAQEDLRDEEVRFARFSIEERKGTLSVDTSVSKRPAIVLVPNPTSEYVTFKNAKTEDFDGVVLYNAVGMKLNIDTRLTKNELDVSGLGAGVYYVVLTKMQQPIQFLKCIVQ